MYVIIERTPPVISCMVASTGPRYGTVTVFPSEALWCPCSQQLVESLSLRAGMPGSERPIDVDLRPRSERASLRPDEDVGKVQLGAVLDPHSLLQTRGVGGPRV